MGHECDHEVARGLLTPRLRGLRSRLPRRLIYPRPSLFWEEGVRVEGYAEICDLSACCRQVPNVS